MNGSCAITTFDNPYNPFEQFSNWFLFDVEKGYNTCSSVIDKDRLCKFFQTLHYILGESILEKKKSAAELCG